jgi:hypothetical protein
MLKMKPVINSKLFTKPLQRSRTGTPIQKKDSIKRTDSVKTPDTVPVKAQSPPKTALKTKTFSPK